MVDVLWTELLSRVSSIAKVTGIFNSTTNYILTRMAKGEDMEDSLKEAQVSSSLKSDEGT